jgi:hypothetical protein
MVQRSALSGVGEGSVKQGRAGLVRQGSSFETAMGTLTPHEAAAVRDVAAAAAAAAAGADSAPSAGFRSGVAECA